MRARALRTSPVVSPPSIAARIAPDSVRGSAPAPPSRRSWARSVAARNSSMSASWLRRSRLPPGKGFRPRPLGLRPLQRDPGRRTDAIRRARIAPRSFNERESLPQGRLRRSECRQPPRAPMRAGIRRRSRTYAGRSRSWHQGLREPPRYFPLSAATSRRRARDRLQRIDAIAPPFFGAIGDEFGAVAFALFEVALQQLRPQDKEVTNGDSGGMLVVRESSVRTCSTARAARSCRPRTTRGHIFTKRER